MISFKVKGIDAMLRDLEKMQKRAIPHAMRNAVNTAAFEARSVWQREIGASFTLRNKFTQNSIRVTKAFGTNTARMAARVGSVAPYMDEQERGATIRGKSRSKPIPAPAAAGQAPGTKRTKAVRPGSYLGRIRVVRRARAVSPKQRNLMTMLLAQQRGEQHAVLERPNGGKGIFRISGGKTFKRKRLGRRRFRLRLLYDLSKRSVRVPAEPTLQRTLKAVERKLPHIFSAALLEQLRRNHIAGY
jgi:hypothetical protein